MEEGNFYTIQSTIQS